jgi:hypothetical protein
MFGQRLLQLDKDAKWLGAPGQNSPLTLEIGLGNVHANARFHFHRIAISPRVSHYQLNRAVSIGGNEFN